MTKLSRSFCLLKLCGLKAVLAGMLAGAVIGAASAQISDFGQPPPHLHERYVSCLYGAQADPVGRQELTRLWLEEIAEQEELDIDALVLANHCLASALFEAQDYVGAAQLYLSISETTGVEGVEARGELLMQAGAAFFADGLAQQAAQAQRLAADLIPWDPAPYLDLAFSLQAMGELEGAIKALDTAIALAPQEPELQLLRATALRQGEEYSAALRGLNDLLVGWPGYGPALLERGVVKRVMGDVEGAAVDWLQLVELYPTSDWAKIATENLENL